MLLHSQNPRNSESAPPKGVAVGLGVGEGRIVFVALGEGVRVLVLDGVGKGVFEGAWVMVVSGTGDTDSQPDTINAISSNMYLDDFSISKDPLDLREA